MPLANASARSSGTRGSTVYERRIASLNFARPSLARNESSLGPTKLAVVGEGSRRQRSDSLRPATSKAPSAINRSTSARRLTGWPSPSVELEFESDIINNSNELRSAFQVLDQQSMFCVD